MAQGPKIMTGGEQAGYGARAGKALVAATCIGLLAHVFDARAERQELRVARAESKALAAERELIALQPIEEIFPYYATEPVTETVSLNRPFLMQSTARVDFDGPIYHSDRLRCFPVDAAGNRGKGQLLRPQTDSFPLAKPRLYGSKRPDTLPEGYKWTDGQWSFAGQRPDEPADCVMVSSPCVKPMGVEKCVEVESTWIKFRELSVVMGVAVWRQRKRVAVRKVDWSA